MITDIKKRIDIDLYSPTSYEVLKAQQGDNLSRIIEFVLYDQGNLYKIPDNITAKLEGHRGDNSSFIKENCFVTEHSISVTLDSDILYAHGIVEAKIVMYDLKSDKILSTIPFKIHVQKNPCNKFSVEENKKNIFEIISDKISDISNLIKEHLNNTSIHISSSERQRINQLSNETLILYDEELSDSFKDGDFYLKEYE